MSKIAKIKIFVSEWFCRLCRPAILPVLLMFIGLIFSTNPVLGFYGNDKAAIDQIILEQDLQKQKLDFIENSRIVEDQSIKNLITAVDIKKDISDEKENAYDKAINQITWLVIPFGIAALIILTGLGLWHNKQLVTKKEELQKAFDKNSEMLVKKIDEKSEMLDEANKVKIHEVVIGIRGEVIGLKDEIRGIIVAQNKNISVQMADITERLNKSKYPVDYNSVSKVEDIDVESNEDVSFK